MLSDKQQKTIDAIKEHYRKSAQMPSVRTLSQELGVSTRAVQQQIVLLKKKGYLIHQEPITSSYCLPEQVEQDEVAENQKIPYVGAIAAGKAIPSFETENQFIDINTSFFGTSQSRIALTVVGDSMLGDHISDGDIAIIEPKESWQQDDILALRIDSDDYTLKRVKDLGASLQLLPSNPSYESVVIQSDRIEVIGKFVGLLRRH